MDNQLPAEVENEIWEKAKAYARMHGRKEIGYYSLNWQAGATEYAIKLHECQLEIKDKDFLIEMYKMRHDTYRTLLEKVISRHEGGLLPDQLLYNEIKTFLDGSK